MVEITHSKARQLLQASADRHLEPDDRSALETHLQVCEECLAYANHLTALEDSLRAVFHKRWDDYIPDLNLQAIKNPFPAKVLWSTLFGQTHAIGQVTIIAALLIGYLVIVNLVGINPSITNDETPTVLPTPNVLISNSNSAPSPTPPIHTSLTDSSIQVCKTFLYIVQENDTIESIAVKFGLTKESILEYNSGDNILEANQVFAGMELAIPICEKTPSRTASIPSNTLTITPPYGTILPDHPE